MTLVWLAVVCLVATMFFSAAEMAFIAANRLRLRHLAEEGNRVAARLPRGVPQSRARAVDRDDGRDRRPHRRLVRGDVRAACPRFGARGRARGHRSC